MAIAERERTDEIRVGVIPRSLEAITSPEIFALPEAVPNPTILLMNTRVFVNEFSRTNGGNRTLLDIPDSVWDEYAKRCDAIWFMGIYKPSDFSRNHALKYTNQYTEALPDLGDDDVVGSPYAIPEYSPNPTIAADWEAFDILVDKLHDRNIKVYLDFVPNHVAVDHPWAKEHPEYFIEVDYEYYEKCGKNDFYPVLCTDGKMHYLAHGRDKESGAWADTLQLNYANPKVQERMEEVLMSLVDHCDGVRCDMAMLINDSEYYATWGWRLAQIGNPPWPGNFWKQAIPKAKKKASEQGRAFSFFAEAYRDKPRLLEYGFDGVYEKEELYDALSGAIHAQSVADKLRSAAKTDGKYIYFTENHDEARAVDHFGREKSLAILTILTALPNGYLLIHDGQDVGRHTKIPMQINRVGSQRVDERVKRAHDVLLHRRKTDVFRFGTYTVAYASTAGDETNANLVVQRRDYKKEGVVVVTNFSAHPAKGYVPIPNMVSAVGVVDLATGQPLPPDKIALPKDNAYFVKLDPWESQMVWFTLP
jgi:glycosidase